MNLVRAYHQLYMYMSVAWILLLFYYDTDTPQTMSCFNGVTGFCSLFMISLPTIYESFQLSCNVLPKIMPAIVTSSWRAGITIERAISAIQSSSAVHYNEHYYLFVDDIPSTCSTSREIGPSIPSIHDLLQTVSFTKLFYHQAE